MFISQSMMDDLYKISSLDILDNSIYLNEQETVITPQNIPIFENKRLGINTVFYDDIENLDEDIDIVLEELAEANNIDKDSLGVIVEDYRIIMDPSIIKAIPKYIIKEVSENSIESTLVESCLYNYLETENEEYLDIMCNPECLLENKNWSNDIKYYDKDIEVNIYKRILYSIYNYLDDDIDTSKYSKSWTEKANKIKSALDVSLRNKIPSAMENNNIAIPVAKQVIGKLLGNDETKSFISAAIKNIPNFQEPVKFNGTKIDSVIRSQKQLGTFEKIRREFGLTPLSKVAKRNINKNLRQGGQTSRISYKDEHDEDSVYGDKPKLRKYDTILSSIIKKGRKFNIYDRHMINDYRETINDAIEYYKNTKNPEGIKRWQERLDRFNNIIKSHNDKFDNHNNQNEQPTTNISSNNTGNSPTSTKNNTKETEFYRELSNSLSPIISSSNKNKKELQKTFANFYASGTDSDLNDIKNTLKELIRTDPKFRNKLPDQLMRMPFNATIVDNINHDPSMKSEKDIETFTNMFKDLGIYNKDDEDFMDELQDNIDYLRDDIKKGRNTAINLSDVGKSILRNEKEKDDVPEVEYTLKDDRLNSLSLNNNSPVSKEEVKNVVKGKSVDSNTGGVVEKNSKKETPNNNTAEEQPVSKEEVKNVIKGDQTNKPKLIDNKIYSKKTHFYNDLSDEEQNEIVNREYTEDELKDILKTNPKKFKFIRQHNDNVTDKELDRIAFEVRRDMGIHGKYFDKKVKTFEDLTARKLSITDLVTPDEKEKLQDKNTDKVKLIQSVYDRLKREGNTKALNLFSKNIVRKGYNFGGSPSINNDDYPSILTYRDLNAYKKAMENIGVVDKDVLENELGKEIRENRIRGKRTDRGVRVLRVVDNLIRDSKESGKPIRGIAKKLLDKLEKSITDDSQSRSEDYKNELRTAIKSYRNEIDSLTNKEKEEVKNTLKDSTSRSTPPPIKQTVVQQPQNNDTKNKGNNNITPAPTDNNAPSKNEIKKVISGNDTKPVLPINNNNKQTTIKTTPTPTKTEVKNTNTKSTSITNNDTNQNSEEKQTSTPTKTEVEKVIKGNNKSPELPKSTVNKNTNDTNTNDNKNDENTSKTDQSNNISDKAKETVVKTAQAIDNGKKEGNETTPQTTNNPKSEVKDTKSGNNTSPEDSKDSKKEEKSEPTSQPQAATPVASSPKSSSSSGRSGSSGGSGGGGGSYGGGGGSSSKEKDQPEKEEPKEEKPKEEPKDQSFLGKVKRALINKPREFIAKMAAKLRSLYSKWMEKAKAEENQGKASWYKKIALKILKTIDYVMSKLSNYQSQ